MKNNIISILIGCVLVVLVFNIRNLYIENINLSNQVAEQEVTIVELNWDKQNLISVNNEISEKLIVNVNKELKLIKPLMKYDKQTYLALYKQIMADLDGSETIYDYTTDEEFELICGVIEAEAGICDFNGKVSVANVIMNRYWQDIDSTWNDVLFADNQFSTVSNGMYKKVEISEDTKEALEFAFLFGDINTPNCLYFRSGDDNTWHDESENLEEVYFDGWHHFYREKEKE